MNTNNTTSTILYEHKKVVNSRYILAAINFIAILLGSLITLFFVQRRGIYDIVLKHIYALIAINVLQIALCLTEYISKCALGRNIKFLPKVSYCIGFIWIGVLISELLFATKEAGAFRIDLLIIACIQLVMALIAYIFWPMMDRKAIDAMIRQSVRENSELKNKKSKRFVVLYGVICLFVVFAQAAALIMYKLPPALYDLFADSRALQYEYNEALDGYEVKAVYQGTSTKVNIPATYNNKPVVGIASGAIVDPTISEKYKFTEITFGTKTIGNNGEETIVCNLTYLSSNAIVSNTISDLKLPASLANIADGAIKSDSLKNVTYESVANFTYSSFNCSALKTITMSGDDVGQIYSLDGMPSTVTIRVDKEIYNAYRQANMEYVSNFSPLLDEGEFCLDFFTGSDYYIDSIFKPAGETIVLNYTMLVNNNVSGVPISFDTLKYIQDKNEMGNDGAKANSAFRGWYYDSDFSLECVFTENGNLVFDKDTKLYAKWIDEYTGTLDWGTHKPVNAVTTVYWTDSNEIEFPVVTDRVGYKDGVTWMYNNEPVTTSYGISKNITLNGVWNLDAPSVSLVDSFSDQTGSNDYAFQFALNYGAGQFTYDETRSLTVSATPDHPLGDVTYSYNWYKEDNSATSIAQNYRVSKVADAGKYFVTVTAVSPTNEVSSTTCELDVTIYKKQIVMEGVSLPNMTAEYVAKSIQIEHTGTINSNNVDITYRYYDANNNYIGVTGVTDVGEYFAEAILEKDENYEIVSLKATITVTPKTITVVGWDSVENGDDFIYDGGAHSYQAVLSGLIDGYDAGIVYTGNVATVAGKYVAAVSECTNKNYKLDVVNLTHAWEVYPKTLTVSYWQTGSTWNTSNKDNYTVGYNGGLQNIYAVASGIVGDDTVNFVYDTQTGYAISATNAGKYTAHVIGVDNANYTVNASSENSFQNWTIEKRMLYASFEEKNFVYNGVTQTLYATVQGFVSSDKSLFASNVFKYSGTGLTVGNATINDTSMSIPFSVIAAGSYFASVDKIEDATIAQNYALTTASREFAVDKKIISISLASDGVKVYSGGTQDLYLLVNGVVASDIGKFSLEQFTFSQDSSVPSGYVAKDGQFKLAFTCQNAGDYPVKITAFNGDPNYKFETGYVYAGNVTIARRQIDIESWTVINKSQANAITKLPDSGKLTYNYNGYEIGYVLSGVCDGDNVQLTLSDAEGRNAENYITTATLDENVYTNYTFIKRTLDWTIEPKGIAVSWNILANANITYDATEHIAVPSYDGQLLGDDVLTLTVSGNKATAVGDYTASVTDIGNSNYKIISGQDIDWNIVPREIKINWILSDLVYNGQYQGPVFTVENLVDATLKINASIGRKTFVNGNTLETISNSITVDNSGNTFSFAEFKASVDAGTYEIISLTLDDGNYVIADATKTLSFDIAKKPIQLTGVWSFTNNGYEYTLPQLTYNKKQFVIRNSIADGVIVDRLGKTDTVSLDYGTSNYGTNAQSYTTTIKGLSGTYAANYELPKTGLSHSWTINPKRVDIIWSSNSFVYAANTKTQNAYIATGATNDDDGKAYETVNVSKYEGHTGINAGTYTAIARTIDNTNYVINSATDSYEWVIAPAPVTLNWSANSFVYNGSAQAPTATYYNAGTKSYVTVTSYNNTNNVKAGNYTITVLDLADDNYTLSGSSYVSKDYSITPRQIILDWYAIYDGSVDAVSLSNLVYNAKSGVVRAAIINLCGNDDVNIVYSGNATFKSAGYFEVSVEGLEGDDVGNYTYDNCYTYYTIARKQLTVTWMWDDSIDNHNPIFDGKSHTLKPILSGFEGDDNVTFTYYGDAYNGVVNSGSYGVEISSLSDATNYYISTADEYRSLYIAPQTVKVTWSGDSVVEYDGTNHTLVATVTGVENDASVNVDFQYVTGYQYYKDAKTNTVKIALNNSNYVFGSGDNVATLTINPQPVKITWTWDGGEYKEFVYDGTYHYLNATVVGAKDNKSVTCTSSSYNSKSVCDSTLTVKLSDTNYVITGDSGSASASLVITPKPVSFVWGENVYTYDNQKKYCTPEIVGVIGNDSISLTYSSTQISDYGSITSTYNYATNAGVYKITVTKLSNSNYKIADNATVSGTLTINPYKAQVTWPSVDKYVYTGSAQNVAPTAVLGVNGATVSVTYPNGNTIKDVGSYTIKVVSSNYNYVITENAEKTYEVTPKFVSLSWTQVASNGYVYDKGIQQGYGVSIDGLASADNGKVSVIITGTFKAINAGNYSVTVTGLDGERADNYVISADSILTKSYTISKQPIMISWSGAENVSYNGMVYYLKATLKGANDGIELATASISGINAGIYTLSADISDALLDDVEKTNYEFTSSSGALNKTLTIKAARPTISWTGTTSGTFVYDGSVRTATAILTGVNGEEIKRFSTSATNVGTYSITVTETGSANYTLADMSDLTRSFTITPAKVTVEWSGDTGTNDVSKAIVYDATNHTMTATVRGVGGVVLKTYYATGKDAGVYTIVVNDTGNANYTIDGVSSSDLMRTMWIVPYCAATFDITNANYNSVTKTNQIVYTGEQITPDIVIKDSYIGDNVFVTKIEVKKYDEVSNTWVNIDASQIKEVGQYRVWIHECSNSNYIAYSEGTFIAFEIVNAQ